MLLYVVILVALNASHTLLYASVFPLGSSMNERLVGPVDDKQAVLEGMQEYEALDYRRSINRMYRCVEFDCICDM